MAADLYEAIADAVHGDTSLSDAFGSEAFLWLEEAPEGTDVPHAVLVHIGQTLELEQLENRLDRLAIVAGSFQVTVWDTDRATAKRLATALAQSIETASRTGRLTFEEGRLTDVARNGVMRAGLDSVDAPDGSDAWGWQFDFNYSIAEDT